MRWLTVSRIQLYTIQFNSANNAAGASWLLINIVEWPIGRMTIVSVVTEASFSEYIEATSRLT